MRVRSLSLSALCTAWAALAAAFDAGNPPTVRGLVGVPSALVGNVFVERFGGALEEVLSQHPNLILKGHVETVPFSSGRRAMPQQGLDVTVDVVFYAEVIGRSPDPESGEPLTHVEVRLFNPETQQYQDAFEFLAKDEEAEEYAEIAVDALIKRLLRRRLGVMRILSTASPRGFVSPTGSGLVVTAERGELPPREIPTTSFTTLPRPGGGYETLSPPLLEGDYVVTLRDAKGTRTRSTRVLAERSVIVDFLTDAEEPLPPPATSPAPASTPQLPERILMPGVGDVHLTRLGTNQRVVVRYETRDLPLSVVLQRGATGSPKLLWAEGVRPEQLHVEENDAVTLRDIPYGGYTVGTWRCEPSAYGKLVVAGRGARTAFRLAGRELSVSLEEPDPPQSSTRLNLVWDAWGPPHGATVTVDGAFIADVLDAAELSVLGLPEGERLVRFEARGYEPVVRPVRLSERREETLFLALRPSQP